MAHLRISKPTLLPLLRDGSLPSVRIAGRRFVTADDLAAFIERNRSSRKDET